MVWRRRYEETVTITDYQRIPDRINQGFFVPLSLCVVPLIELRLPLRKPPQQIEKLSENKVQNSS